MMACVRYILQYQEFIYPHEPQPWLYTQSLKKACFKKHTKVKKVLICTLCSTNANLLHVTFRDQLCHVLNFMPTQSRTYEEMEGTLSNKVWVYFGTFFGPQSCCCCYYWLVTILWSAPSIFLEVLGLVEVNWRETT